MRSVVQTLDVNEHTNFWAAILCMYFRVVCRRKNAVYVLFSIHTQPKSKSAEMTKTSLFVNVFAELMTTTL